MCLTTPWRPPPHGPVLLRCCAAARGGGGQGTSNCVNACDVRSLNRAGLGATSKLIPEALEGFVLQCFSHRFKRRAGRHTGGASR
eukprot:15485546-Alexandrium_andersonii.AAC.1